LTEAIRRLVAKVLQTSVERIDVNRRLDLLGMDSLMAAELVSTMHRSLGCDIPAIEVINSAGIADLARRVLTQTRG
ncbi:MAG: acyl carrier protein, partial [Mycobacterium sp.]|nr:acyl carrier protein [Mycobacterium sp.]